MTEDISLLKSGTLSVFQISDSYINTLAKSVKTAVLKAKDRVKEITKDVTKAYDKVKDKYDVYDMLSQKYEDGSATGDLITKFKPEYESDKRLVEEARISYITSAWYKSEYWYSYVKSTIKRMVQGDETANFMALDYLVCLRHGIKTEATLKNEFDDSDPISVQMEYLNIPSGSSGKAFFKPQMFKRSLKRAFYPQREISYNPKKNPYGIKKLDGELRFLSIDVATRANKANDLTIVSCARLLPMVGKGYERHLVYMESYKGKNTLLQSKRIKEIFYDFEGDYIVIDLAQAGVAIFDSLSQVTPHDERGIDMDAMTIVEEIPEFDFVSQDARKDLESRTIALNAEPVIFPILATAQLNSKIAYAFRGALQSGLWKFIIPDQTPGQLVNPYLSRSVLMQSKLTKENYIYLEAGMERNIWIKFWSMTLKKIFGKKNHLCQLPGFMLVQCQA